MFINHSPLTSSWNLQLQAQGSFGKVFHFWITHLELWLVGWLVGCLVGWLVGWLVAWLGEVGYPEFLGQHVMSARWETSIRLGVFWVQQTPFWVAEKKHPKKMSASHPASRVVRKLCHSSLVGNFAIVGGKICIIVGDEKHVGREIPYEKPAFLPTVIMIHWAVSITQACSLKSSPFWRNFKLPRGSSCSSL